MICWEEGDISVYPTFIKHVPVLGHFKLIVPTCLQMLLSIIGEVSSKQSKLQKKGRPHRKIENKAHKFCKVCYQDA